MSVKIPTIRGVPPVWTGEQALMIVGEGQALEWLNLLEPEVKGQASGRPIALHPNGTVVMTRPSPEGVEFVAWSLGETPRTLTTRPRDHAGWVLDLDTLMPVAALDTEGPWQLVLRLEDEGEEVRLVRRLRAMTPFDDPQQWVATPWASEGRLLVTDEVNDRGVVAWMELSSGALTVIAEGPGPKLEGLLIGADQQSVSAFAVEGVRQTWISPDPTLQSSLDQVSAAGWDFRVMTRARDDQAWLLDVWSPLQPVRQLLFLPKDGVLLPVGHAPRGAAAPGVRAEVLRFEARDGLELDALLVLPPSEGPPPVVVFIHGGPWHAFQGWWQDPLATRLAAQGYAVLSPNFRGSGGGGRARVEAARGELGDALPTDVLDALAQAAALGLVDTQRVAFVGGSYGGYAVLRILTKFPDSGLCGVSTAGRGVLMTRRLQDLLGHLFWGPPWRRLRWSPTTHLRQLRAPVLMLHGSEDDRVAPQYARPFARRALRLNKTVTYLEWPQQGHWFEGDAAEQALAVQDTFLAECLGGPKVELSDALRDAELAVTLGAEHVPGLAEALAGGKSAP
ncbi:MAG: S9 family peptidase [Deltaproteobacteria bacterium]|nr:S9 family peptidase [Deltaproteobacteria bacterium]